MELNKIDFIVKTLERYDALDNFLKSVLKYYPTAKISVADDSQEINEKFYEDWKKYLDVNLYKMPFDSGLSAGRNLLLDKTNRPYVFLLDDDFEFTKETDVFKLKKVLDYKDEIMIAAGMCMVNGTEEEHYEFDMEYKDDILKRVKISGDHYTIDGIKAYKTDSVLNFFLAKRELFNEIRWENELKIVEHMNFFFWFLLSKHKCLYVPEVKINHMKNSNPVYKKMRIDRRKEFHVKSMIYSGIKEVHEDGLITKLVNNKIVFIKT